MSGRASTIANSSAAIATGFAVVAAAGWGNLRNPSRGRGRSPKPVRIPRTHRASSGSNKRLEGLALTSFWDCPVVLSVTRRKARSTGA